MSTTTTNLELIKPDMADRALIGDINDNMDIIDGAIGNLNTAVLPMRESVIDNTVLEEYWSGVLMGTIASAIHGTADTYGIVRAYAIKSNVIMQIAEFADGVRKTRLYSGGVWDVWN